MNRYTFRGFPYPEGSPMGLLQDYENKIEDRKLIVVKHGSNITNNHPVDEFICSECGIHLEEWVRVVCDEDDDDTYYYEYAFKFCPECGADVRKEQNVDGG